MLLKQQKSCELCSANATVFCPSDSAFLCNTCDSKVHDANFLVARHIRQPICYGKENELSDDESSACISSTTKERNNGRRRKIESPAASSSSVVTSQRRRVLGTTYEAEGIFVNWCGKLGISDDDVVVRTACEALRVCLDKWKFLPYRVGLAASIWVGLRGELSLLKRLEEVSGVPTKIILAAESKVSRSVQRRSRLQLEEGWAES